LHRWNFVVNVNVEELTSHRVNSPVLEPTNAIINLLVHHANDAGLDFGSLQHLDLSISVWETVNDPSVHLAVALLESFINKTHSDIVGNFSCRIKCFLNALLDARVLNLLFTDQGFGGDTDKSKLAGDKLRLSGTSRAGWTNYDHFWRSTRSAVSESYAQHSRQIVDSVLGIFAFAVVVVNVVAKSSINFSLILHPVLVCIFRK